MKVKLIKPEMLWNGMEYKFGDIIEAPEQWVEQWLKNETVETYELEKNLKNSVVKSKSKGSL